MIRRTTHPTTGLLKLRSVIAVFALLLVAGCGPSESHLRSEEALRRLQKVDAATTVGVNYSQYRQLLVDAQEAVNAMDRADKPVPGREEIQAAMETYKDAGQLWDRHVQGGYVNTCHDELSPLIKKYRLDVTEPYQGCSQVSYIEVAMAYQVWPVGKQQIAKAEKSVAADKDPWTRVKATVGL